MNSRQDFLAGLPPCPYAAEALVRGQVAISTAPATEAFAAVTEQLDQFAKKSSRIHIVAVGDWQNLTVEQTRAFVGQCREAFYQRDLWLMYDHPQSVEVVREFSFNHGTLLLFMIQRLSDLAQTADELRKTGYYRDWPQDYYDTVVGIREDYYRRYLEQQMSTGYVARR